MQTIQQTQKQKADWRQVTDLAHGNIQKDLPAVIDTAAIRIRNDERVACAIGHKYTQV
jgi:hypothetical protein